MSEYDLPEHSALMPALFVGHGNPMNAIEDNAFSQAWQKVGKSLPRPSSILCISAHWETPGVQLTAMANPRTIHDFYGFPSELYKMRYPAPGSPTLANLVSKTIKGSPVALDFDWGFDHGAWSVLCRMFPMAEIPVVQLSLNYNLLPKEHFALAKELKALRTRGVLIIGSGNIVHNLQLINWEDQPYDWALEFDELVRQRILAGDHESLVHYEDLGQIARLAIPTNEHYLPLLYVMAVRDMDEELTFFAEEITLGSISMRSIRLG
jgi:4,5-DOPA dioxygenase extradiol